MPHDNTCTKFQSKYGKCFFNHGSPRMMGLEDLGKIRKEISSRRTTPTCIVIGVVWSHRGRPILPFIKITSIRLQWEGTTDTQRPIFLHLFDRYISLQVFTPRPILAFIKSTSVWLRWEGATTPKKQFLRTRYFYPKSV